MKRNSNFKIFKVIKSMSQTKISHYLLSSTFNDKFRDLILLFYILVPNTTIKGTMKNIWFKQHFSIYRNDFTIPKHFFVYLTILTPFNFLWKW